MKIGPFGVPGNLTYLWKYMKLAHLKDCITRKYLRFTLLDQFTDDHTEGKLTFATSTLLSELHNNQLIANEAQNSDEPKFQSKVREEVLKTKQTNIDAQAEAKNTGAFCLFESKSESALMWDGYGGWVGSTDHVAVKFDVNQLMIALPADLTISRVRYVNSQEIVVPYSDHIPFYKDDRFVNELEVRITTKPTSRAVEAGGQVVAYEVNFDWKKYMAAHGFPLVHAKKKRAPKCGSNKTHCADGLGDECPKCDELAGDYLHKYGEYRKELESVAPTFTTSRML